MKKKIILLFITGMACASIAACGHKEEKEPFVMDEGKMKRVTTVAEVEEDMTEAEEDVTEVYAGEEIESEEETDQEETAEGTVSVELTEVGPNKVKVIKVVREITGYGLKESKDLVDAASDEPVIIVEGVTEEEAQEIKAALEAEEAKVTIE